MHIDQLYRSITEHENWISSEEVSGSRLSLCGATLSGMNLRGALLQRSQLQGAHLPSCDFSHANLNGAGLQDSYLHKTNFYGARLMGASLKGANFHGTNLNYADLRGADLRGTDLRNASLVETILPELTWVIYGETYYVQITNGLTLRVGCQEHPIADWRQFSKETVQCMDGQKALDFYPRLIDIIDFCMGDGERPEWVPPTPFNSQPPMSPHLAFGPV